MAGFEGGEAVLSAVEGDVVYFWPSREDICSILVQDCNGVVWEHCHLSAIEPGIALNTHVAAGQRIGTLGRTGPTGNLANLHLGTYFRLSDASLKPGDPDLPIRRLNLYPWLVTAYRFQHPKGLFAVARPHHTVLTSEKVVLDGSHALVWGGGKIVEYRWVLPDGRTVKQARAEPVFDRPGAYVAVLWVKDDSGTEDVDFCQVKVFSKDNPERNMPHIYMSYTPTEDVRPEQPVRFRFWMQGQSGGPITVELDDGATMDNYEHYSEFAHSFKNPGVHIVTARCEIDGRPITQKLKVVVTSTPGPDTTKPGVARPSK
jgi:hypothetical protein